MFWLNHRAVGFLARIKGCPCHTARARWDVFLCSLPHSQRADSRMCPHLQQRTTGESPRAASSPKRASSCPNPNRRGGQNPAPLRCGRKLKCGRALKSTQTNLYHSSFRAEVKLLLSWIHVKKTWALGNWQLYPMRNGPQSPKK
jgi:hypothetical protein